jgi:hypothetical protein
MGPPFLLSFLFPPLLLAYLTGLFWFKSTLDDFGSSLHTASILSITALLEAKADINPSLFV